MKHNKYFIESSFPDVLQKLLKDPVIQECRLRKNIEGDDKDDLIKNVTVKGKALQFGAKASQSVIPEGSTVLQEDAAAEGAETIPDDITNYYEKLDKEDEDEETDQLETVSFEVNQEKIEVIQKRCIELEYPLLAEYDFRNDTVNQDIKYVQPKILA